MANFREMRDLFTLYHSSEVMTKSSFYCMMHSLQSTYIFRMKTISDFPSTIWNLTSVKHNSDSVKTTPFCLSMFCKYQQIWLILRELFLGDWKAFVFYSENWYIYVNTVVYYKDLIDQCPSCL